MDRLGQVRMFQVFALSLLLVAGLVLAPGALAADMHTSKPFAGVKVNGGTVTHSKHGTYSKSVIRRQDIFLDAVVYSDRAGWRKWQRISQHRCVR